MINFLFREKKEDLPEELLKQEKVTGFKYQKIISLEDPFFTLKSLFYIYLAIKVSSILGDRFILLIVLNIFIFYAPLNKKYPHFLFISRMSIKQVIEGTVGIIECFIPRYIEEKSKKNN